MEESGFQTGTVARPEEVTGGAQVSIEEKIAGIKPTRGEQFVSLAQQALAESPFGIPGVSESGAWARFLVQSEMEARFDREKREKLTKDQANSQYPGMPVPFSEDVYPEVAQLRYDDFKRRQSQQAWIESGPEFGFGTQLLAGATTAFDPVNMAFNILGGAALKAVGVPLKAATVFAENLAGNLAADVPSYIQQKREGQDINLKDVLIQDTAAAVVGTGIFKTMDAFGARLRKTTPEVEQKTALKAVIAQHENGAKIDTAPAAKLRAARAIGKVQPGTEALAPAYQMKEVAHPSETVFYAVADDGATRYGGRVLEENGIVANNRAVGGNVDVIEQVQVKEGAKILDLEKTIADPETKTFMEAIRAKVGDDAFDGIESDFTIRQALDVIEERIDSGDIKASDTLIKDTATEQGYKGMKYVDTDGDSPRNVVSVLDDEVLESMQQMQANREITPRLTPEEIRAENAKINAPESSKFADADIDKELAEIRQSATSEADEEVILRHRAQEAERRLIAKKDEPAVQEKLTEIELERQQAKQLEQVMQTYADCITTGIL